VRVEPRSNHAIAAGMSRQWDAAYAESLANAPSGRKALDARGLHHSGFDVARGKSGVGKNQKLDLERHPEKARATQCKMRAKDRPLANDFMSDADFEALLLTWFGNAARVLRPGGGFHIWGGFMNLPNYPPALKGAGLYFSQAVIWVKEHPVLTRKDFMASGTRPLPIPSWRTGDAWTSRTARAAGTGRRCQNGTSVAGTTGRTEVSLR
jgi:hypothetical protein